MHFCRNTFTLSIPVFYIQKHNYQNSRENNISVLTHLIYKLFHLLTHTYMQIHTCYSQHKFKCLYIINKIKYVNKSVKIYLLGKLNNSLPSTI